ncbi:MAG: Wzt carbohydrate-binding domain-containing protein, partial [Oscillospiraceae bacterium]|nr:Wzt carbohydrate-binding domain-containing protein [Oscillospiraceae bacterium]
MDEILITANDIGKKIKKRKKGSSLFKPEYEEITILSDVNLTVNRGECVVVIGESGAGKTLLLDILSGKDNEFSGGLSLSPSAYINEIAKKLSPRLSGEKNILHILSTFGIKKKDAISVYDKIAVFSELSENLEKPVREYSFGMKMRLVFSAVAFSGAGLVIIDDMPSAFDRIFTRKVTDKIEELRLMGKSFIISDNTINLPLILSAKTVSMSGGKMISVGNPAEETTAFLEKALSERERRVTEFFERQPLSERELSRWGNQNIEIIGVDLFSGNGKKCYDFDPEGRMVIRIEYRINRPVSDIGFSVGIFGVDGVCRYFTDTYIDEVLVDIKQRGRISLILERSGLLENSYRIDVAAHDKAGMPYDYVLGISKFKTSSPINDRGMYR